MASGGLGRALGELQGASSKPRINSSVLVIVIILSVVIFCSGILHILARCLGRRRARDPPGGSLSSPNISVRLQHLFSLHDSGVEQEFIDTLPVFLYGSIRGLKDSADCAVCLNEFANEDKLRLLPKCKHAFHTDCIDTWLLSNSTCPLCRRSLLPEPEPTAPPPNPCTTAPPPNDPEPLPPTSRGSFRSSLRGSFRFLADAVSTTEPPPPQPPPPPPPNLNPSAITTPPLTPGPTVRVTQPDGSEKTLRVELGKVSSFDSRRAPQPDAIASKMARSYSVGSYEYVVDVTTLRLHSQQHHQELFPVKPTHRSSLSDSLSEIAPSGSHHTPWQEDMFWASRGLETPRDLSRVREIMTPSPVWLSSPSLQPVIRINSTTHEHTVDVEGERRSQLWEVSVDVPDGGDSSSPPPLHWLGGRSKRSLVYSDAISPATTDMAEKVT